MVATAKKPFSGRVYIKTDTWIAGRPVQAGNVIANVSRENFDLLVEGERADEFDPGNPIHAEAAKPAKAK